MKLDFNKDDIILTGEKIKCTNIWTYVEDGNIYVKYYGRIMTNKGEIEIYIPKLSMDFTSMDTVSEGLEIQVIKNDILFECELVEKPMTKEQIEKELGYKIKIIKK